MNLHFIYDSDLSAVALKLPNDGQASVLLLAIFPTESHIFVTTMLAQNGPQQDKGDKASASASLAAQPVTGLHANAATQSLNADARII